MPGIRSAYQPRGRSAGKALLLLAGALFASLGPALLGSGQAFGLASKPKAAAPFPVSVKAANGVVQIARRPTRIISLSPSATEDLFGIGAAHQVIAVDNQSDYPPGAPKTNLSGYQPNVEAIAKYAPDLVVVAEDSNSIVASLTKLHIAVLLEPAANNLADAYGEMTALGAATGHRANAEVLISKVRSRLAAIVKAAPKLANSPSYYYELDQTYYSETSSTFIGKLLALFKLRDVADQASGSSGGYPQLSAEYIIHAAPAFIFLADTRCCAQSARTVAARPGWSSIPALKNGDVVALDDDIASRWGPRIVTLAQDVERALWKYSRQH